MSTFNIICSLLCHQIFIINPFCFLTESVSHGILSQLLLFLSIIAYFSDFKEWIWFLAKNQQCLLFLGPNFSFQAQLFLSNHLFLVSSTRLHLYFVVKTPVLGKLLFLIISFVIISRFFQYLDANASWLNSVILNYPIKSSFAFILLILLFGGFSK